MKSLTKNGGRGFPIRLAMVALAAALQSSAVLAVDPENAAKTKSEISQGADVSWLSGGVGDDAMSEMRALATAYNVQVLLTGRDGHYLASIPFTVSRRNGQVMVSGVTEGPLLYVKLPAGRYQIAVEIDGAWQTRHVRVSDSGKTTKLHFVAKGE
ncbi:MAG: hypothetical protein KKE51_05105 [Gammaproteobacteria bacterium]|nr:hypothetical protein [Gammaproteobacteria bacterium]MBU2435600.1 hypothetical protein [Gammaproteobacteria bacterium]MBU2449619.1 hypothetical protein [Gammaproteobacteria bacterium]